MCHQAVVATSQVAAPDIIGTAMVVFAQVRLIILLLLLTELELADLVVVAVLQEAGVDRDGLIMDPVHVSRLHRKVVIMCQPPVVVADFIGMPELVLAVQILHLRLHPHQAAVLHLPGLAHPDITG